MPSCDTIAVATATNSGAVSPHPPPLTQDDTKPTAKPPQDQEKMVCKAAKTEKQRKNKSNSKSGNNSNRSNSNKNSITPPPSFASIVMANFVKIFLTCGVYFWYLAARAVFDTIVETAKNLYETHRAHLDDIQERMCENHVNELYHGSRRRAAARRLHLSKDDSHLFAESSSDGTVKLRLRHSLKKRKEQIIFGSPRSPASPASPVSGSSASHSPTSPASPSSPVENVNSLAYHQQLNGTNCRRARTNSELLELDDQVMPLPNIRHRSRRWKSCGNITTTSSAHKNLFRVNQLHKKAAATEPLYINNNNRINKNGLSQDRKLSPPKKTVYIFNNGDMSEGCDSIRSARLRNPSADDVEVTRRRALLLMRRQGRQLSDPSSYKLLQQQLVAARAVADNRHNQRYLVVDRRLESLSLEPSSNQKNVIRQPEANGHVNNNVRENIQVINGGGGEGAPRYLLQKQQQQLQRVKSAHRGP